MCFNLVSINYPSSNTKKNMTIYLLQGKMEDQIRRSTPNPKAWRHPLAMKKGTRKGVYRVYK